MASGLRKAKVLDLCDERLFPMAGTTAGEFWLPCSGWGRTEPDLRLSSTWRRASAMIGSIG